MNQLSAAEYIGQGQIPFFRMPQTRDSRDADVIFLGVPWDAGTTYRPGARFAPWELRRVSALVQSYHPHHGVDVFATLSVVDGGNIVLPPFDAAAGRALIEAEIASQLARPFVVGGDHSITLPVLRALARKHGPLAVVHVDAHQDMSSDEVWGEPFHHGTPFRHALTEGCIGKDLLFQIGLRATWGRADEGALAERYGVQRFDIDSVSKEGIGPLMRRIRQAIGNRPVYLSFDIDAVDPAYAPGTGTPVPGGLTSREAITLVRGMAGMDLVGMDLVEVAPGLDHADITLHLGAHLLYEGLAALAVRRRM